MPADFLDLTGRDVLVMGVANRKSVAWHVAQVLTNAGARVIYAVRSDERAETVRTLAGSDAAVICCDVERPEEIERLAEEVISVWDEVLRLEGELATERQRARAMEMELEVREGGDASRAKMVELEEALRVADLRIAQMEVLLENERSRRVDGEMGGGEGRLDELQEHQ